MIANLFHHLRLAATGLTLALVAHGAAHAGLVRGDWDPVFGPALPNLSWQVRSEWLVPNACSNQADGVYSTAALGPCQSTIPDPVRLLSVWVRWFDTNAGDPNNFFEFNAVSAYTGWCESVWAGSQPDCNLGNTFFFNQGFEPLGASNVRVAASQIVGFDTGITSFLTNLQPNSAGIHQYDLSFKATGPTGPVFTCFDCEPVATADNTNLNQYLITYVSSNASEPKFVDSQGNPVGVRLDGAGNVIPEPATLALLGLGLAGLGFSRRKQ